MSEAIAIKPEQCGATPIDPLALELQLQGVLDDLLAGKVVPGTADAVARLASEITRIEMVRLKIFKMTTRSPSKAMLRQWSIE